MYSPTLGRFLPPDPIGTKIDLNLYAYVKNNPVKSKTAVGDATVVARNNFLRELLSPFKLQIWLEC